jgi:hypothetical protein
MKALLLVGALLATAPLAAATPTVSACTPGHEVCVVAGDASGQMTVHAYGGIGGTSEIVGADENITVGEDPTTPREQAHGHEKLGDRWIDHDETLVIRDCGHPCGNATAGGSSGGGTYHAANLTAEAGPSDPSGARVCASADATRRCLPPD